MAELGQNGILTISTLEEIQEILAQVQLGQQFEFPKQIVFAGDLRSVELRIEGPDFHRTVPGAFARGLWGFQEEIYRAVAAALYKTDDLRKLSKEDLENFNLVFHVNEGSSEFEAGISGFLTKLGEGLSNMDDTYKLVAILGIAVVLALGYAATKIGAAHYDAKVKRLEIDGQIRVEELRSQGETARLGQVAEIVDNVVSKLPEVAAFKHATAEGTKQAVKASPNVIAASLGVVSFDQDAVKEIKARSARESTERDVVRDWFLVTGHRRPPGADMARFSLSNKSGELSAIVDLSEGGPLSAEQREKFWKAVQEQTMVYLQVIVSTKGGQVKQAIIDDMPDPEQKEQE
ncbi:hypothetical protein [Achromobacter sp. UMC71]|uniref:hypothetical protein n=1 Tax=Achromobacter sp. UMC71 TaxID=1862320 RepID=UPI0015FF6691|nr:hypothetical protein [Achromobacter sp. UMC71]MBB1628942.1 hypothetical protein [Achromobacter sp. UMC71]